MLVSVRDVRFWQITDVIVGLVVLVVALIQIGDSVSARSLAVFIGVLFVGLVTIYCFWLMLASASFWLIRMNEVQELFDGVYRAGQYPVGIYPGWLKYGLTFLVPLAFAITVPSEALTGRLTWQAVSVGGATMIAMLFLSRWFWRRGLRRYDGASA